MKKNRMFLIICRKILNLNLTSRIEQPFEISTQTSPVLSAGLRWLKPLVTVVTKGISAVMVERSGRNPCWLGFGLSDDVNAGRRRRSKTLNSGHKREIGR